MSDQDSPPNVLLIVLDCVRAADFPRGDARDTGMPFCSSLRGESVVFPRAASPTPWTIPSHASLFSGVQPWETGCHWKGDLRLDPSAPRLAARLQARGYRTLSLSANPLICPTFNLVDGFDQAAWAQWWEPYFRWGGQHGPAMVGGAGRPQNGGASRSIRTGAVDSFFKESTFVVHRYPFLLDWTSRLIHNFRADSRSWTPGTSPWIEPTLDRWVGSTPADQPVFAFVNLLDAHEPYFSDRSVAPGMRGAVQYFRARQDNIRYDAGLQRLSEKDLEFLHRLYVGMIRQMDARIERLVSVFRAHRRWDNTQLILTSDHGQAFGEHGILFHMIRVDEQLTRIPLWVRYPHARHGGATAQGWASLVDVFPSVTGDAEGRFTVREPGVNLEQLIDRDRPQPLPVISDGVPWGHNRSKFPAERLAMLDRVRVAAYERETKLVLDGDGAGAVAFDVSADPGERHDLHRASPGRFDLLRSEAERVRGQISNAKTATMTSEVEDRLKSWGYL